MGTTDSTGAAVAMLSVFGSAKFLAELLERFRQPGMVGEVLAGILIGPAVLGWVIPNSTLTTLADLGVMFLLFRVGLEIRPGELLRVQGTALMVATLGVILPFALGWAVMYLWNAPVVEAIFVAAALVATSVGITAQILAARGLLDHQASRVILAAAVIDDVLGLIVLSVVSAVAHERVRIPELILSGLLAAGFMAIVARWGAGAIGRVFPHIQRNLRAGEIQFNLAMVIMFSLALIGAYVGVAAIVGAFLAGMVLSEVLEQRVYTLASGVAELLTPFFLVGVGLHVARDAFALPTLALAGILTIVAVVSKLAGCGLGAIQMGRGDALRVGSGMVPRGEVGMVVAQVGLRLNVISAPIYTAVVLVAVLTTLLGPVLLNLAFRGVLPKAQSSEEFSIG